MGSISGGSAAMRRLAVDDVMASFENAWRLSRVRALSSARLAARLHLLAS